jgi:hypothetical protein
LSARLENMFLNSLKYRHFIGQSEHVFKKLYFLLSRRPENLGLKIWFKSLSFALERLKKALSFAYNYTPHARNE